MDEPFSYVNETLEEDRKLTALETHRKRVGGTARLALTNVIPTITQPRSDTRQSEPMAAPAVGQAQLSNPNPLTPPPLMALVREMRNDATEFDKEIGVDGDDLRRCADKLETALKAWAEQLDQIANQQSGILTINSIKWRVLGVEDSAEK